MVDPALHAGVELADADPPGLPGPPAFTQAAPGAVNLARFYPPVVRVHQETQPGNTMSYRHRLRLYLRLAHHWNWLSDGQYQHVSAMVAEIGRLLGGWLRHSRDDAKVGAPGA